MKQAITKTNIDQIDCGDSDIFVWDLSLKGFGVKITPQNRRVFIFQYRDHRRKTKRVTLGKFGTLTVSEARRAAKILDGQVNEHEGNLEHAEPPVEQYSTIEELSSTFMEHYVSDLKPRTQVEYSRVFSSYLPKSMMRKRPEDVTRSNVSLLRSNLKTNPHGFNRTVKVMSKFYNWLYDSGIVLVPYNPFQRIKKFKEKSSERFLSYKEIEKLCQEIEFRKSKNGNNVFALSAIELLLLTGARKSEILTLRWTEVCLDTGVLNLEDSKTGKKSIYLNEPAKRILQQIPRLTGNQFVIVGRKQNAHLTDIRKVWKSVCISIGISNARIHDLRHTFASLALKNGVKLNTIGALLGHSDPRTTQRYVHFDNEFVKTENEKTGLAIINRTSK